MIMVVKADTEGMVVRNLNSMHMVEENLMHPMERIRERRRTMHMEEENLMVTMVKERRDTMIMKVKKEERRKCL